jgi:hypothetical protein
MKIKCSGCASTRLYPFLDLGETPLADRFPATADEDERYYELGAVVCEECWLTQNSEVIPDAELYGSDYGFMTGASPSSVEYFRRWSAWALAHFGNQARMLTVEIASNDGTLLHNFKDAGCRVVGIDPAGPASAEANANGIPTYDEPFNWESAGQILEDHGPAGLIIACNVAAHVSDLFGFLSGIRRLLSPNGTAIIEFQYLPRLIAGNQFDHVYHEHRCFFTLDAFSRACEQAGGLKVLNAEHTSAQGGSLRVMVARSGIEQFTVPVIRESEKWLRSRAAYSGMQGRAEFVRDELLSILASFKSQGKSVAGYAASAKSSTLLNFCGIGPDLLDYVVDTTPDKIGKFTPGTKIPIISPEQEECFPDAYLVLAWNYLPGIIRREKTFLDCGGQLIVPIPVPVIL